MTNICPKCLESVEFSARTGKPLPHRLDSGFACGGFIDRVLLRSLAPERTDSPLARLVDRYGRTVTVMTLAAGRPIPRVVRYFSGLEALLEAASFECPVITFNYVGLVTDDGCIFHQFSERGPFELCTPPDEQEASVITRTEPTAIASPSDLASFLGRLLGRS